MQARDTWFGLQIPLRLQNVNDADFKLTVIKYASKT
jgi:hypothetical protein